MGLIHCHLVVSSFNSEALELLSKILTHTTLTKDDLADIINAGIEVLMKHLYELPVFGTSLSEAKAQRTTTYQVQFRNVHKGLSKVDQALLDALFSVGDVFRTSPWNGFTFLLKMFRINVLYELSNMQSYPVRNLYVKIIIFPLFGALFT
jgi:hypothetical protein